MNVSNTLNPIPMQSSGADISTRPYNLKNRLITRPEVRNILSKYGVTFRLEDGRLQDDATVDTEMNEFYKSFVHRSYCTRKNENFLSGNAFCPPKCLPLQE